MTELASAGQLRMSYTRAALVLVPLVLVLGIASGVLSGSGEGNSWFAGLAKPAAMPPAAAFPIVWTILYVMLGLALASVLVARGASGRVLAIGLFVVQMAFNLAWSPVFFAAHRIGIAFGVILLAIVFTVAAILAFARVRRRAAWALVPYLAWLCFAAWLNHRIDVLNPNAAALAPGAGSTQVEL